MEQAVVKEVQELHQFFQDWFTGTVPQSETSFARVTVALDPGFTLVNPDGSVAGYATVLKWLRAGYGTRPGFRLWTDAILLRHQSADFTLATYEEWQQAGDGRKNRRLSSACFLRDSAVPNRVSWLHVHETWLKVDAEINSPGESDE